MSLAETLPLLVVVLLVLAGSGVDPSSMEIVFDGERTVETTPDAYVVAGGTVTVPENATVRGQVFVVGGDTRIAGRVSGDVRLFAGNLSVPETGTVTGELQTVAGTLSVAPGADIGRQTTLDVDTQPRSPLATVGFLAMQMVLLGGVAALLVRRVPGLFATVGDAVTHHPVVSGVVGSIAGTTMLVLFVYMAFTLVLLPLSIVGLVAEFLLVLYGYLVYGYLVGQRLPVERVDIATGFGVAGVLLGVDLLGRVPYLGTAMQFLLVVVGLGAVLITYLGVRRFEPPQIPGAT
ncbi:polymer-forming cytoskeletal protein [Halorientalis marina]|uniref:polymer-forming cytoskeletal protein n=1 Tax=Halorientalis marina TaxID=2931976 RepID=UPI001FF44CE1|nr:polymer-forming cytoskeletal protein [Halorientalis marina]